MEPVVVPRIKEGRVLTYQEQMWEVASKLIDTYALNEKDEIVRIEDSFKGGRGLIQSGMEFLSTETNKLISSPFLRNNRPQVTYSETPAVMKEVIKELDRRYLKDRFGEIDFDLYDLTIKRTPRQDMIARYSLYNCAFGEQDGYKFMVNTAENVSEEKILKLFAEFSKNDGVGREHFEDVARWIPKSLTLMNKFLCVEKNRGKYLWTYKKSMLRKMVSNPMASAGIRPGHVQVSYDDDIKFQKGPNGKKVDQFPFYAIQYHQFISTLYKQETHDYMRIAVNILQYYNHLSMKNEYKYVYPIDLEEAKKLVLKCREFFIPNMSMQFLSRHLMAARQYAERGAWIRIGHNWNARGAEEMATWLWGGMQGMRWNTGDFNKLDKSIRDWILSLYVTEGRQYFTTENIKEEHLLDDLFIILAEKINVKLVNHIGEYWTLMKAWMYSGGYETSHGDSWAVMLSLMLFIVKVQEENPTRAEQIEQCLKQGLIRAVIYGDDHIWCCPEALSDILNESLWGQFLKRYIGGELRDTKCTDIFFTTYNHVGEIVVEGVVFLKRYFIRETLVDHVGYPSVYPFKPTHETMIRLAIPRETVEIYPLAAIGQAFDTMGTNHYSYEMLRLFYCNMVMYCSKHIEKEEDLLRYAMSKMNPLALKKLLMRSGRTVETMLRGFPTREELLSRHRNDAYTGQPNNTKYMPTFDSLYGDREEWEDCFEF